MRRALGLTTIVLLLGLGLAACTSERPGDEGQRATSDGGPLSVYVVNYPLKYFAERIGADQVHVSFPAPLGEDPAYWSPQPEVVADYQQADLVLLNGAGFARWIAHASLPRARMVDTSAAFADRLVRVEETVTHSHGPEGDHDHHELAFTVWLDPLLAVEQARAVTEALATRRPEHEVEFRERFGELQKDLEELDRQLEAWAAGVGNRPILFSHPVYQYFTARYGLNARDVHWEPDGIPDAKSWQELEELRREHPTTTMIWEGPPLEATVEVLRGMGIESVVFDPCGNTPENGDFLSTMHDGLRALTSAQKP